MATEKELLKRIRELELKERRLKRKATRREKIKELRKKINSLKYGKLKAALLKTKKGISQAQKYSERYQKALRRLW